MGGVSLNVLGSSELRHVPFCGAKRHVLACETSRFALQNDPFQGAKRPQRKNGAARAAFSCNIASKAAGGSRDFNKCHNGTPRQHTWQNKPRQPIRDGYDTRRHCGTGPCSPTPPAERSGTRGAARDSVFLIQKFLALKKYAITLHPKFY